MNPEILRWARETSSLSLISAASKLGLRDTKTRTAVDRLRALEDGTESPSRSILLRMAKQYRRPLLTFYLSSPPAKGDRGQDFRTLPDGVVLTNEALLDALIRDVLARQSLIRSAILDEDVDYNVRFVGSVSIADGQDHVLQSLRKFLDFPLALFRRERNVDDAFLRLRRRVEQAGVFTLLLGNLGSYHTDLDLETFRGFALSDPVAPFIIINDHDHRGAWSFTLLHELTHLWLGQTGVSGGSPDRDVERFCNNVAAEFLLPANELSELTGIRHQDFQSASDRIGTFANERNVSRSMVAYRLYRGDLISRDQWFAFRRHYRDRWMQNRAASRSRSKSQTGGPDYYVLRRHRLGSALLSTTARFMEAGVLTTTKAGRVLGVKPKNVQNLLADSVYSVGE